jgi:hypothetical protein
MRLVELSYKQEWRAQRKADEWSRGFPHLSVSPELNNGRYRIRIVNKKTGRIGYVRSGKLA